MKPRSNMVIATWIRVLQKVRFRASEHVMNLVGDNVSQQTEILYCERVKDQIWDDIR
jgi:hypothetical protein